MAHLAPLVKRLDNVNQRINRYPLDKYYQNLLSYPVDSDLFRG